MNEVQGLRAWIEELTNNASANTYQQGSKNRVMIERAGGNPGGMGRVFMVEYARVIRRNRMLEEDYMGMVTTTLMYSMRERMLMNKL